MLMSAPLSPFISTNLPPKNHYILRLRRGYSRRRSLQRGSARNEHFNSTHRINIQLCESAIFFPLRFVSFLCCLLPLPPPLHHRYILILTVWPYFIDFIINTAIKPAMFSSLFPDYSYTRLSTSQHLSSAFLFFSIQSQPSYLY